MATRFAERDAVPPVAGETLRALKSLNLGRPSNAKMRERLVSQGLATSKVGSLCRLTRRGHLALASAIEARRATTPKSDAVHESAGPKGDAQPDSNSPAL